MTKHTTSSLTEWVATYGKGLGVTVSELSSHLNRDEGAVRRWAREHGIRRCGATFVFSESDADQVAQALLGKAYTVTSPQVAPVQPRAGNATVAAVCSKHQAVRLSPECSALMVDAAILELQKIITAPAPPTVNTLRSMQTLLRRFLSILGEDDE